MGFNARPLLQPSSIPVCQCPIVVLNTDGHLGCFLLLVIVNDAAKKKILPFVTASMDLENIILSEISQSEKDKYHVISHICRIE